MKKQNTRIINSYQKEQYTSAEISACNKLIEMYIPTFESVGNRETINILDIGGGNGSFSLTLKQYFSPKAVFINILDSIKYDSWDDYGKNENINFFLGSAYELESLFQNGFFDIIFINRTLHHLVFDKWRETIKGYNKLFSQIHNILKDDGYLCVTEETAESYIKDRATSYIIYKLTSCKFKIIVKLCKKLDGKSAGVGVCFLSNKSWKDIFTRSNFIVEREINGEKRKIKLYWRFLLLLKNYFFFKGYVLRKN
jgi:SAM-dependent methyltransferase